MKLAGGGSKHQGSLSGGTYRMDFTLGGISLGSLCMNAKMVELRPASFKLQTEWWSRLPEILLMMSGNLTRVGFGCGV